MASRRIHCTLPDGGGSLIVNLDDPEVTLPGLVRSLAALAAGYYRHSRTDSPDDSSSISSSSSSGRQRKRRRLNRSHRPTGEEDEGGKLPELEVDSLAYNPLPADILDNQVVLATNGSASVGGVGVVGVGGSSETSSADSARDARPTPSPSRMSPQPRQPPQTPPQPPQPPQLVADVSGGELCPSLHRLFSAHRPHSQFDRLLLTAHCLMVESGFVAVGSDTTEAAAAAVEAEVTSSRTGPASYDLPESAARQLQPAPHQATASSVSIAYAYRRAGGSLALLKLVNTGRLAACHCAVAASLGEPPAVVASEHFNIERFIGHDRAGNVSFNSFRHLSVHFKDCIAERAKAAIHEACGLPPLGLAGLPAEVLLRVLRHCDFASVCRLGQASSRLGRLCDDNAVWREQLRSQAPKPEQYRQARDSELRGEQVNYREVFRALHEERTRRLRMIARLSNRELSVAMFDAIPGVLPPLGNHSRGRNGGGRFSLDAFPEMPPPDLQLGGRFFFHEFDGLPD